MPKSLIEYAYDLVSNSKDPISFKEIWDAVKEGADLDEATAATKVGRFYTNLMLDGRFVNLGNNLWDLRERHTFDKVHIDMKDAYTDIEIDDRDNEENEGDEDFINDKKDEVSEDGENEDGENEDGNPEEEGQ